MIMNEDELSTLDAFIALDQLDDDDVKDFIKPKDKVTEQVDFDLNDPQELAAAKEVMNTPEGEEELRVIDIDADAIDHIKKKEQYIGQALLRCNRCMATRFMDLKNLKVDFEDDRLYNTEDECPHCRTKGAGYSLIGQVGEMSQEAVEQTSKYKEENSDDLSQTGVENAEIENDNKDVEEPTIENDVEPETEETTELEDTSVEETPTEETEDTEVDTLEDESENDLETDAEDDTENESYVNYTEDVKEDDTDSDDTYFKLNEIEEVEAPEEKKPVVKERPRTKLKLRFREAANDDVSVKEFLDKFVECEDMDGVNVVKDGENVYLGKVDEMPQDVLAMPVDQFDTEDSILTVNVSKEDDDKALTVKDVLKNYKPSDDPEKPENIIIYEDDELGNGTRDEMIEKFGDYNFISFEKPAALNIYIKEEKAAEAEKESSVNESHEQLLSKAKSIIMFVQDDIKKHADEGHSEATYYYDIGAEMDATDFPFIPTYFLPDHCNINSKEYLDIKAGYLDNSNDHPTNTKNVTDWENKQNNKSPVDESYENTFNSILRELENRGIDYKLKQFNGDWDHDIDVVNVNGNDIFGYGNETGELYIGDELKQAPKITVKKLVDLALSNISTANESLNESMPSEQKQTVAELKKFARQNKYELNRIDPYELELANYKSTIGYELIDAPIEMTLLIEENGIISDVDGDIGDYWNNTSDFIQSYQKAIDKKHDIRKDESLEEAISDNKKLITITYNSDFTIEHDTPKVDKRLIAKEKSLIRSYGIKIVNYDDVPDSYHMHKVTLEGTLDQLDNYAENENDYQLQSALEKYHTGKDENESLEEAIFRQNNLSMRKINNQRANEYWIHEALATGEDLDFIYKNFKMNESLRNRFKKETGYRDEYEQAYDAVRAKNEALDDDDEEETTYLLSDKDDREYVVDYVMDNLFPWEIDYDDIIVWGGGRDAHFDSSYGNWDPGYSEEMEIDYTYEWDGEEESYKAVHDFLDKYLPQNIPVTFDDVKEAFEKNNFYEFAKKELRDLAQEKARKKYESVKSKAKNKSLNEDEEKETYDLSNDDDRSDVYFKLLDDGIYPTSIEYEKLPVQRWVQTFPGSYWEEPEGDWVDEELDYEFIADGYPEEDDAFNKFIDTYLPQDTPVTYDQIKQAFKENNFNEYFKKALYKFVLEKVQDDVRAGLYDSYFDSYCESVKSFKTRKELSEALKNNTKPYSVKKSFRHGYRYDLVLHEDANIAPRDVETVDGEVVDPVKSDSTDVARADMSPEELELMNRILDVGKDTSDALKDNYNIDADPRLIVADIIQDLRLVSHDIRPEDLADTPMNNATKEMFKNYEDGYQALDQLMTMITGHTFETTPAQRLEQATKMLDSESFSRPAIYSAIGSDRFIAAARRGMIPYISRDQIPALTNEALDDDLIDFDEEPSEPDDYGVIDRNESDGKEIIDSFDNLESAQDTFNKLKDQYKEDNTHTIFLFHGNEIISKYNAQYGVNDEFKDSSITESEDDDLDDMKIDPLDNADEWYSVITYKIYPADSEHDYIRYRKGERKDFLTQDEAQKEFNKLQDQYANDDSHALAIRQYCKDGNVIDIARHVPNLTADSWEKDLQLPLEEGYPGRDSDEPVEDQEYEDNAAEYCTKIEKMDQVALDAVKKMYGFDKTAPQDNAEEMIAKAIEDRQAELDELAESLDEAKKPEETDAAEQAIEVVQAHTDLVQDEIDAVGNYADAIETINDSSIKNKDEIVSELHHIKGEELEHIDELEKVAELLPQMGDLADEPEKKPEPVEEEPVEEPLLDEVPAEEVQPTEEGFEFDTDQFDKEINEYFDQNYTDTVIYTSESGLKDSDGNIALHGHVMMEGKSTPVDFVLIPSKRVDEGVEKTIYTVKNTLSEEQFEFSF